MCVGLIAMSARAAEKAESPSVGVSEKVSAIDAYVRSVEKNISSSENKEQYSSRGELKKVTNENFTKCILTLMVRTWKRMKLYAPAGSQGQRVLLSRWQTGLRLSGSERSWQREPDQNATGDKYYFADGKLIAATAADGKSIDVKSAEAKKMSEKLQKESQAFQAAVK